MLKDLEKLNYLEGLLDCPSINQFIYSERISDKGNIGNIFKNVKIGYYLFLLLAANMFLRLILH